MYQFGKKNKSYLIAPWTTETVTEQTCFETNGSKAQSILPSNVADFKVYRILKQLRQLSRLKLRYTLRLIGTISYPGECNLIVHPRKYSVIFRVYFLTNASCYLCTCI